jgi:hypothetical protein
MQGLSQVSQIGSGSSRYVIWPITLDPSRSAYSIKSC